MDETIFREISSQIARDVEQKVRDSMQNSTSHCSGEGTEKSGTAEGMAAMGPEMGKEMFEMISREVSSKIAQSIASNMVSKMSGAPCGSEPEKDEKPASKEGESKIQVEFSRAMDCLVSNLEGSICTILDLIEDGSLSSDAAKKKITQVRSQFRSDLDELMKKRNWKLEFLQS